jgi:hypothetical protein
VPSKVSRSFSKISTPSKPTEAAASSFSGSVPYRDTVAIDRKCLGEPSMAFIEPTFPGG